MSPVSPSSTATATAPRTRAGRRRATGRPRRVSGPMRPAPAGAGFDASARGAAAPAARPQITLPASGARVLEGLRALPDHRFTDRLVGGRAWIPVVGMLLIGIVTMQVGLLRMNAGIGRSVERSAALERENAAVRAVNGRLSSDERVRAAALRAGLVDPIAGSVRFLRARGADAAQAVKAIAPPGQGVAAASASAAATTVPGATTTSPYGTTTSPYATTPGPYAPTASPYTATAPTTTTSAPTTSSPATTTPSVSAPAGTVSSAPGTTTPGGTPSTGTASSGVVGGSGGTAVLGAATPTATP